jgi:hypothetical protein
LRKGLHIERSVTLLRVCCREYRPPVCKLLIPSNRPLLHLGDPRGPHQTRPRGRREHRRPDRQDKGTAKGRKRDDPGLGSGLLFVPQVESRRRMDKLDRVEPSIHALVFERAHTLLICASQTQADEMDVCDFVDSEGSQGLCIHWSPRHFLDKEDRRLDRRDRSSVSTSVVYTSFIPQPEGPLLPIGQDWILGYLQMEPRRRKGRKATRSRGNF